MGQTAHGIPWPVGTDRLMDGDDSIRALAEYVDAAIYNVPRGKLYLASGASGALAVNVWTSFASGLTTAYAKGGVAVVGGSQLRVPSAGLYRIQTQVYYQTASSSGAGIRRGVRCHLNNVTTTGIVEGMVVHSMAAPTAALTAYAANDVELAANDTLALGFFHDQTGANQTAIGNPQASYTYIAVEWLAAL